MKDASAFGACPYCGSEVEVLLDPGGAEVQSYIEDCEICCRPIRIDVHWDGEGSATVDLSAEDD